MENSLDLYEWFPGVEKSWKSLQMSKVRKSHGKWKYTCTMEINWAIWKNRGILKFSTEYGRRIKKKFKPKKHIKMTFWPNIKCDLCCTHGGPFACTKLGIKCSWNFLILSLKCYGKFMEFEGSEGAQTLTALTYQYNGASVQTSFKLYQTFVATNSRTLYIC